MHNISHIPEEYIRLWEAVCEQAKWDFVKSLRDGNPDVEIIKFFKRHAPDGFSRIVNECMKIVERGEYRCGKGLPGQNIGRKKRRVVRHKKQIE